MRREYADIVGKIITPQVTVRSTWHCLLKTVGCLLDRVTGAPIASMNMIYQNAPLNTYVVSARSNITPRCAGKIKTTTPTTI
jgi:hypothetical protein